MNGAGGAASSVMRAAVVAAPGRVEVREVPLPEPGPGELRFRLEGCGVCASNLPPWEGRPWFTYPLEPGGLGHEGWGVVDAVGPGVEGGVAIGDRVAALSQHAYAEYDVVPARAVVPLPPALAEKPFPGEPLGCAINIFARSGIQAGQDVAIVGIGFLGALLTRLASAAGARVLAIARRPFALDVAKTMGAAETIPFEENWRVADRVKELTGGALCPVVVEAVGKQEALDLAGDLTGERGRFIIAGYHQDGLRQVNLQQWNWRGIDVINAHERDEAVYLSGIRSAVDAVSSGALDPAPLYTHAFPLERLGEALDATGTGPTAS
jgi:threonine dehydrogenase-like Zn-dependent dehydrogenase